MPRKPPKLRHLTYKAQSARTLELEREGGGSKHIGLVISMPGDQAANLVRRHADTRLAYAWVERKDARRLRDAITKWLDRGDRRVQ